MCEVGNVIMMGALVAAAWEDWRKKEVSVCLLLGMNLVAIVFAILCEKEISDIILGVGIGSGFFLISKITEEKIGYGDSWLITILGIQVGGRSLLLLLFTASFGAAIFSMIFCMLHQWNRKYSFPFIPFLCAAFWGVIMI